MALKFRMKQRSVGLGQQKTLKWFPHPVVINQVDLRELAQQIQDNCTVKRADVLAVLDELVQQMTRELQNSHSVKLDGFGSFRMGIEAEGVSKPEDFDQVKNIKRLKVIFLPEGRVTPNGVHTRALITGCRVSQLEEPGA